MFFLRKTISLPAQKYIRGKSDISDYDNAIRLLNGLLDGSLSPFKGIDRISFYEFSRSIRDRFVGPRDHLLPILVHIILQGKTSSNPLFNRQVSLRVAVNTDVSHFIPPADHEFTVFCATNANSINDFLSGNLSAGSFLKTLDQLKTYAEKNPRNYHRFLIISFVKSYALDQSSLSYKILNYYQFLFKNLEGFRQKGGELFMDNLPVPSSRVLRLNGNLRPFRVNSDFDQLNTYKLGHLTSELTAAQAEKLLNYICQLAKLQRARGKNIVFSYLESAKNTYLQDDLGGVLANRLDSYNNVDFLDLRQQTFLGYRFYFYDDANYLEILLDKAADR